MTKAKAASPPSRDPVQTSSNITLLSSTPDSSTSLSLFPLLLVNYQCKVYGYYASDGCRTAQNLAVVWGPSRPRWGSHTEHHMRSNTILPAKVVRTSWSSCIARTGVEREGKFPHAKRYCNRSYHTRYLLCRWFQCHSAIIEDRRMSFFDLHTSFTDRNSRCVRLSFRIIRGGSGCTRPLSLDVSPRHVHHLGVARLGQ